MSQKDVACGNHIIQYDKAYSLCTGCHSCQLVCALVHDGVSGPEYGRIQCEMGKVNEMIHTIHACQQCQDHPCYNACPKKDQAMCIDDNGIVYVNEESCIGCGLCVRACCFQPPRVHVVKTKDKSRRKAKKCDLCRTRPEGPACVEFCPVRALGQSKDPLPEIIKVDLTATTDTSATPSH